MSQSPAYRELEWIVSFEQWVAGSILNLDSVVECRLDKGKIMKKTLLKSLALTVVGSFCVVGAANALMLDGGLSMTGSFIPVDANNAKTTITDATGIDFGGYFTGAVDNTFAVTTASSNFASLIGGGVQQTGTIANFQFASYTATPGIPLWTTGDFSFEMTSLTYEKDIEDGNNDIHIYGLGLMRAAGYDLTII